jgi:hypothetical protein
LWRAAVDVRQIFSVALTYCRGQFEDIAKFKKDICPPVLNYERTFKGVIDKA